MCGRTLKAMTKRNKFVVVSLLLVFCLWLVQLMTVESRLLGLLAVTFISYLLSAWVLFEDLKGMEWLTLMILPVGFTLGAGLFSYYLPNAVPSIGGMKFGIQTSILLAGVAKTAFFFICGLGLYAILLTENIYSVASIRTIQLLRAARSVGFILTMIVALFFFQTFSSVKMPFYFIGALVFIVGFVLSVGGLWAIDLKSYNMREIYTYSAIIALLVAQLGMVLAVWPVKPLMASLVMVAGFYSLLGLFQQRMVNRVFLGYYAEYIVFPLIVILTAFLITSWRG